MVPRYIHLLSLFFSLSLSLYLSIYLSLRSFYLRSSWTIAVLLASILIVPGTETLLVPLVFQPSALVTALYTIMPRKRSVNIIFIVDVLSSSILVKLLLLPSSFCSCENLICSFSYMFNGKRTLTDTPPVPSCPFGRSTVFSSQVACTDGAAQSCCSTVGVSVQLYLGIALSALRWAPKRWWADTARKR